MLSANDYSGLLGIVGLATIILWKPVPNLSIDIAGDPVGVESDDGDSDGVCDGEFIIFSKSRAWANVNDDCLVGLSSSG